MKVEGPRRGRAGHGASFDRPSAHRPAAQAYPSLPGGPAGTLAAPPRRGVAVVGRWTPGDLHRRVAPGSRQHHLCRPPRFCPPPAGLPAAGSPPWGASPLEHSPTQGHLALGRVVPPYPRLVVCPLVAGQTPRLSDPQASGTGHQPRAPAESAQKRGFHMRRWRRKLLSSDPQRRAILCRLKGLWRHRRRGELLAFFDVQPITVKAYGGRRYTREKQLILPAKQKT